MQQAGYAQAPMPMRDVAVQVGIGCVLGGNAPIDGCA